MRICRVSEKQQNGFAGFVPADVLMRLGAEGFHSLGLFDETGSFRPEGFLQFYSSLSPRPAEEPVLEIRHLFVKEEARFEGNGTKLLGEVIEIGRKAGAKRVLVQLPKDTENKEPEIPDASAEHEALSDAAALKQMFVKAGFSFRDKPRYLLERSLADYAGLPFLRGIPLQHVKPLSALDKEALNQVLLAVVPEVRAAIRQALSDNSKQRFDFDLSCVYRKEEISGIMLVWHLPSGILEIERLRMLHTNDPKSMLVMLKFLENKAAEKYPKEQLLRIEGHTEPAEKLIQKVFPECSPEITEFGTLVL